MRSAAEKYKAIALIDPVSSVAATVTGTGKAFTPNNDAGCDAVAIVHVGALTGAPTTTSITVTIEQSATVGGTYTVTKTFTVGTAGSEIAEAQVILDTTKGFVRAKAVIAFTGGATPSVVLGAAILVKQNSNSIKNQSDLS